MCANTVGPNSGAPAYGVVRNVLRIVAGKAAEKIGKLVGSITPQNSTVNSHEEDWLKQKKVREAENKLEHAVHKPGYNREEFTITNPFHTQGAAAANTRVPEKPNLFTFEKVEVGTKLYHATFGDSPLNILNGINTDFSSAEGRYHQGFYLAQDADTCVAEALKAVNKINAQFLTHIDNPGKIDEILQKINDGTSSRLDESDLAFLNKMELYTQQTPGDTTKYILTVDELKDELTLKKQGFEKELTWFKKNQTVDIKEFYQPKVNVDAILEFTVKEEFVLIDLEKSHYSSGMMETGNGSRGTAKEMQGWIQSIQDGKFSNENLGLARDDKMLGLKAPSNAKSGGINNVLFQAEDKKGKKTNVLDSVLDTKSMKVIGGNNSEKMSEKLQTKQTKRRDEEQKAEEQRLQSMSTEEQWNQKVKKPSQSKVPNGATLHNDPSNTGTGTL